jgi:hypothetical protein
MLPICTRSEQAQGPAEQTEQTEQALTTYVSMDECKRCMVMYESICTEIAQLTKTMKERKAQLAVVGDMISKYLKHESKSEILTRDQRLHLKLRTSKVKVPLKKDAIRGKVLQFLDGETERCDALMKHVYEDRPTVEKVALRRIVHRNTQAVVTDGTP